MHTDNEQVRQEAEEEATAATDEVAVGEVPLAMRKRQLARELAHHKWWRVTDMNGHEAIIQASQVAKVQYQESWRDRDGTTRQPLVVIYGNDWSVGCAGEEAELFWGALQLARTRLP